MARKGPSEVFKEWERLVSVDRERPLEERFARWRVIYDLCYQDGVWVQRADAWCVTSLGWTLYAEQNKWQDGFQLVERLSPDDPDIDPYFHHDIWCMRAWSEFMLGEEETAISTLAKVMETEGVGPHVVKQAIEGFCHYRDAQATVPDSLAELARTALTLIKRADLAKEIEPGISYGQLAQVIEQSYPHHGKKTTDPDL